MHKPTLSVSQWVVNPTTHVAYVRVAVAKLAAVVTAAHGRGVCEADVASGVRGIARSVHKGTLPVAAHGVGTKERCLHLDIGVGAAVHVGVGV